jgi:transcriptional regulator with XRE-family HTH domain
MSTPARPKLFTAALESLMQERGVNQVELSRRTGIAISRINNYLYGKYRTIKPVHAGVIAEALGGGAAGAALIEAYLYDLLPDSCRGLIEIKYPGMRTGERWAVPSKGLSREFAGQFADLYRLCASSAKVRQRTAEWIALMRETKG